MQPMIVGNWKMNKTPLEAQKYLEEFLPLVEGHVAEEIVLLAPALTLPTVVAMTAGTNVRVGAQTTHWLDDGPYTGQTSPKMIAGAGCSYVLVGHGESRSHAHETDSEINLKIEAALRHGLSPILCIGETLLERHEGFTETRLREQLDAALAGRTISELAKLVIAYEPLWAIGSKQSAPVRGIAIAHSVIRRKIEEMSEQECGRSLRVLYGGAVNPETAPFLMESDQVNGLSVGGASLDPHTFVGIVDYASRPTSEHSEHRAETIRIHAQAAATSADRA